MPIRKVPLVNGEYYHVFNHGIDYRDICNTKREYQHLLLTLWFYLPVTVQVSLSRYLTLPADIRQSLINEINTKPRLVEIHAFSLMPNHYHILVKQLVDRGISLYIGNLQNSYTKYFNAIHERRGPLFLSPFRAKRIYSEEQYLHVSRYIHLNRFSSGMLSINDLKSNPYSSLPYYLSNNPIYQQIVYTQELRNYFKTPEHHWEFIRDQADYQRQLERIKHIIEE